MPRVTEAYVAMQTANEMQRSRGTLCTLMLNDMEARVLPRLSSKNRGVIVELEENDPNLATFIARLLGNRFSRDPSEAAGEFIEQSANRIIHFGEAAYELWRDTPEDPLSLKLGTIPAGSFKLGKEKLTQIVPAADGARRRVIKISARDVLHLSFPTIDAKRWNELLTDLSTVDTLLNTSNLIGKPGVDLAKLNADRVIAMLKVTESVGGYFSLTSEKPEEMSEFLYGVRQLQYLRFLAELRESIGSKIEAVLLSSGVKIRIRYNKTPSTERIDAVVQELKDCKISVIEAVRSATSAP